MELNKIYNSDCLEGLKTLPDNSVDSVVTDPPYGLKFMNKHWDTQVPSIEIWKEVFRVMKPGAHLLAFGGTRTYHRMVVNIEDAGFEIRDQLQWIYGSGFPKSLDISKAIDKEAGAEREKKRIPANEVANFKNRANTRPYIEAAKEKGFHEIDSNTPSTDAAKQWAGWGTALKPLIGTVAENVLKHGTGGINIDESRIGADIVGWGGNPSNGYMGGLDNKEEAREVAGRFPANIIFDEEAAKILDEQTGITKSGKMKAGTPYPGGNVYGKQSGATKTDTIGDSGGASRFFYSAKTSPSERGNGNDHPTVKPLALMQYLIKLITPPGGLLLDPFSGSGSTLIAALIMGRDYKVIGYEMDSNIAEKANKRLRDELGMFQ